MFKAKFFYKDDHNKSHHLQLEVNEDSNEKMLLNLGNDISASHVRREDGNHPYKTLYKIVVIEPEPETAGADLTTVYKILPGDPQKLVVVPPANPDEPLEPEDAADDLGPETKASDGEGSEGPFGNADPGKGEGPDDPPEPDNTQKTSKPRVQYLPVSGRQIQVQKPETVAKKTHNFFEKQGHDLKAFDATLSLISMEETVLMSPASYTGKSLKREFYHDLLLRFFGGNDWSEEMFLQFEKISRFFEKDERGRLKKMYKRMRQFAGMQAVLDASAEEEQQLEAVTIIFKKVIPIPNGPPDATGVR